MIGRVLRARPQRDYVLTLVGLAIAVGFALVQGAGSGESAGPGNQPAWADLTAPDGWSEGSPAPVIAGLALADVTTYVPSGDGGGAAILVGLSRERRADLLPRALRSRVEGMSGPFAEQLGEAEALAYRDMKVETEARLLRVHAIPTKRGVVTVACRDPRAGAATTGRSARDACDWVAANLRLRVAHYEVGASVKYRNDLREVLGRLSATRRKLRAQLADAGSSEEQRAAARRLESAFHTAAAAAARVDHSPALERAHDGVVAALRGAEDGYAQLAIGARDVDGRAYRRGLRRVRRGERALARRLGAATRAP
jgi:hypothetical protein